MSDRLTHDEYYVAMLRLVAARSTCARRAVGAIFVDEKGRVLSTGYNGVPSGFPHCTEFPCEGANDARGDTSRCMAVHAEINAIIQCGDRLTRAHTAYVSCSPCFGCAKAIVNTPISRIVCLEEYADTHGREVLKRAGVKILVATPSNYGL